MSFLSAAVHTIGAALFGFSFYYDLYYVHPSKELIAANKSIANAGLWPGKWKYLTIWNVVLQLVYHIIALLNDFAGSSELNVKRQAFLQKLRDGFFAAFVFPTSMLVSISFWTLFTIDRKLIFPIEMDTFYPCWLNHVVHTGPILFLTFDSCFVPKLYPPKGVGYSANILLSAIYAGWIVWVNHISNVWPYPILAVLGTNERVAFIAAGGLVIVAFYFFGEQLNKWRWGSATTSAQSHSTHSKGKKKEK